MKLSPLYFDSFLLISAETDGCYLCGCPANYQANIYHSIEEVVNVLHDMLERKIPNDYPVELRIFDSGIEDDLQLHFEAGCLSGLKSIHFKYNNILYNIKRGNRK